MHIPDGFLNAKTAAATAVISMVGVGIAVRQIRRTFPPNRVPMIGLAAAFIFAAQMLNFPVAGGTSGHLIGAVLAAVMLGPHAAILVMTSVLILQCLLFADGGVTALGANVFNMGILAPIVGYGIYQMVLRAVGDSLRSRLLATAFAAWCSTVAASIACAGQLALSGTVAWQIAFPAMTNIHMLIGIGEGLITTLVVLAIAKSRPELLSQATQPNLGFKGKELIGYGLLISAGLAVFIAPFASSWPDGLERVAGRLGFEGKAAQQPLIPSPLPDYSIPGLHSAVASTVLTGVIGLIAAFCLAYLLARKLTPTKATE
jgi:cobalt/nickel transport system permease protein